ncbi:aldehyde dehydrogenase [Frankia sp. Cr1]|uniref:aldehyde dehydrogenase n=1 Tax=Frankia sp. Cr1 TaxID=3073931 RepID=UPI002AD362F6|nr:aldehyde dehydrogenase [Frankia sp. Cr1]
MDLEQKTIFVDGQWRVPSSGRTIELVNPTTEERLGSAPWGDEDDVDSAVAAARRAFREGPWADSSATERADVLDRLADEVEKRGDELASLVAREIGQPLEFSRFYNVTAPVGVLRFYAGVARERPSEEVRPAVFWPGHTVVRREALGVVGIIVPWNYPQVLAMMKIAPALAAGCTAVVKPAAESSLDACLLVEAAEAAGLPAGVLNVVPGGRDTGELLVRHADVDKIAFTGSPVAGRRIAALCGELLRPVSLELGGKSAAVILEDADLDTVIDNLTGMSFMNSGQTCFLLSRVLAPRTRYDEVVDALAEIARDLIVGDPLDPGTTTGPLVSERQRERVEGYIAVGRADGARLVTGGGRPAGLDRGYFVEPTVFADVDNSSRLGREEVFGPVVAVMPYHDEDEAVALANDSDYGLGGAVYTTDIAHGQDVARRIETGTIGINFYAPDANAPYGGAKTSGLGREYGPEAVDTFQGVKSIFVPAG